MSRCAGERPYHCGACGQRYTQGHLLKAHIRSRHGAEMAYYNMDKRSDGVRCRRSLSTASRMDPSSTSGLMAPGIKEDKIRFLLEAAEAARGGGGGSSAPRPPVPPQPGGPFVGMSLGQYVNALSSCLPGSAGMRPLLWNPTPAFQPLPHDGVTSHAALLSSLAAAPMPSVQNTTSTPAQGVPDRSILNSLLASYATGSPLFSINGLSSSVPSGSGSANVVGSSPLRCPSSDGPAVPQDLSMSGPDSRRTGPENNADKSFLSASAVCSTSTTLGSGYPSMDISTESPVPRHPSLTTQQTDFRASDGGAQWPNGRHNTMGTVKLEAEEATDLSVRGAETLERSSRKSPTVPDATVGTVDLSRVADRKPSPRPATDLTGYVVDRQGGSRGVGKAGCCGDDASCPHLLKLKELRRNVYRMLSVFTPYLDVAGAGIADVEADAVDDFLHEVIYSSKLDQATD